MPRLWIVALLAVAPLVGRAQVAQLPPRPAQPPPVVRVYDVADLIACPPDFYPDTALVPPTDIEHGSGRHAPPRGGGGGGGGLFGGGAGAPANSGALEPATPAERREALAKLIAATIALDGAEQGAPSPMSIQTAGTRLVIAQTAARHEQIAALLAQLRETAPRPLRIKATYVLVQPDELKALFKPADAAGADARHPEIDADALARLKPAARVDAQLTCLSGQAVRLASGRARTVVTAVDALIDAGATFEPRTELLHTGAALTLLPVLAPDRRSVSVDLAGVLSLWNKPDLAPVDLPRSPAAATRPAHAPPLPDRLHLTAQALGTTARIPLNRPILVGGLTLDPLGPDDTRQAYLLLEVAAPDPAR